MALNRSFLFAPGNVARRVEKALTLDADAVIVDLEDSVATAEKAATRKSGRRGPRRGRAAAAATCASTRRRAPFCYGDLVETLHARASTAWCCPRSRAPPTCTRSTG